MSKVFCRKNIMVYYLHERDIKNMALIKCKKCNGDIDSSAQTCPHCGAKLKSSFLEAIVAIILIIIVLCIVWFGI